jgi:hypothetical protein
MGVLIVSFLYLGLLSSSLSKSLMSLPPSLHQPITARSRATVVRMADRKKQAPTHQVSPRPGTAPVAAHRDAYTCVIAMGTIDSTE